MSLLVHPKSGGRRSVIGRIHSVSYSRNGGTGTGFFHIVFSEPRQTARLCAVVTESEGAWSQAFVFSPDEPNKSFSGPYFGNALWDIIRESYWSHELD